MVRVDHAAIEAYCATAGGWLCDEYADRMASDSEAAGVNWDPYLGIYSHGTGGV